MDDVRSNQISDDDLAEERDDIPEQEHELRELQVYKQLNSSTKKINK